MMLRYAIGVGLAFVLSSPFCVRAAEIAQVPYYAAGTRAEGAVAFDMASLQRSGKLQSVRVWQFSPIPVFTSKGFNSGDVQTVEFDCAAGRVRFRDRGVFTAVDRIEFQPKRAEEWSDYASPGDVPDNSLATTAWLLLCGREVPTTWVAYDRLEMIAFDYWSSLVPEPVDGIDAHGVVPPQWAGPNAAEPTGPPPPAPTLPW